MEEKNIVCKKRCALADYCWINIGSARQKVMKSLSVDKMPSQVRDDTDLRFSTVSRSLADLRNHGLVDVEDVGEEQSVQYVNEQEGTSNNIIDLPSHLYISFRMMNIF